MTNLISASSSNIQIIDQFPCQIEEFLQLQIPLSDGTLTYFAGYGYAAIRVDIRGSGDSEGTPLDEYVQQEQDDALEILAWISEQPGCSGETGMIGISWGGFYGLQVAALRPPSLKAVITLCEESRMPRDLPEGLS